MRRSTDSRGRVAIVVAVVAMALIALPQGASAAPPELWTGCFEGEAAGQCGSIPRGVATSPISGHVYVVDQSNRRIVELTAWGEFVKAWGWGVDDGAAELQVCTEGSGCQKGLDGAGAGQLSVPQGIATDSEGNLYVVDRSNFRVQKFDPEGNFLLMFGGGVNQGPVHPGDVCTSQHIVEGDTCGAGTTGTANGQFSADWHFTSYITVGPENQVYVGDENRIQEFDVNGAYQSQIPLPKPGPVGSLAVDPLTGDIYYALPPPSFSSEKSELFRLNATTGEVLDTPEVDRPTALATDPGGKVYVFEAAYSTGNSADPGNHRARIVVFDADGERTDVFDEAESGEGSGSTGIATGTACYSGGVGFYRSDVGRGDDPSFIRAYGIPDRADVCPPPPVAPEIAAQYATSVGTDGATVRAQINPHFWPDATYYVQYGSADCIEGSGWEAECVKEAPNPPGSKLNSGVVNKSVTTDGVFLSGLQAGTAYRFRFISESGGGGPTTGGEGTFRTPPLPDPPNANCPNQAFRLGPSASLPDCRAYELVSPVDKAGGDVSVRLNLAVFPARMDQSALSGDSFTYSSYRPFGEVESAPFSSQYLAHRDPESGWQSESISPPQEGAAFIDLLQTDNLYKAFSPDLSTGWTLTDTEPLLGPGGVAGFPNLYRRENAVGAFEGCTTAEPQLPEDEGDPLRRGPELQGFSADMQIAAFRYKNKLTEDASTAKDSQGRPINQIYVCAYGEGEVAELHLLSVLPDGTASDLENTTGGPTNSTSDLGRTPTLANAVSEDGSRIYWTATTSQNSVAPGTLYLRLNPTEEQSALSPGGKCTEGEKACTLLVAASPARFWTAAKDGSLAIYGKEEGSAGQTLFRYDAEARKSTQIAAQATGVLGASEDASRVYFVSKEGLDGAQAGKPNLYLYEAQEEGSPTYTYVATLFGSDEIFEVMANPAPVDHHSHVSSDGSTVAFMSDSPALAETAAGYDNTDQASGEPDGEVYRYEAGSGELACVSCTPSGARPVGRSLPGRTEGNFSWAASRLPTWLNSLYAPRALSEDGNRVFFESFGPLALSDTNGKADVYQWEAEGTGDCEEGDSAYVDSSKGCLTLISSGKSTSDSEFVDASPEGDDVFIRTAESLLSWDPGSVDIYDARVNGGFAPPPARKPQCEGQSCQGQAKTSNDSTPSSLTFRGPGNEKGKPTKPRRCGPAKRKVRKGGKTRCVRKGAARRQRRTAR